MQSDRLNFLHFCFRNVTNSYKFYWFLAILEELEAKQANVLCMHELAVRMIALVWYPLDYYKLSFGPIDRFKEVVKFVSNRIKVDNSANSPALFFQIKNQLGEEDWNLLYQKIEDLIRYVPYRFIRPFFQQELRGIPDACVNERIIRLAGSRFEEQEVIYKFVSDSYIEIHPAWKEDLLTYIVLIRKFIYWELLCFLQKNNSNVMGLSEKIFKPVCRNLNRARIYWKLYAGLSGQLKCIYSGQILMGNMSLDHFIPWRYMVNDQIWNIVPTSPSVNSIKGDQLPCLDQYLSPFIDIHYKAFHTIYHSTYPRKNALLEDYNFLFKSSLPEIDKLPISDFGKVYESTLYPILQIASNMGFGKDWVLHSISQN